MKGKIVSALGLLATVGVAFSPLTASAQELKASWDNGVNFATADKTFQGKIGARIFNDHFATLSIDDELDAAVGGLDNKSGTEFRDLLFWIKGTINDNLEYSFEEDFAGGDANPQEMWIGLKKMPWGGLRAGHTNEPFGFEKILSSRYLADMERAIPLALAPGRNNGLMAYGNVADKMIGWEAGVFHETPSTGAGTVDMSSMNYTARLFADPLFENDGETVVHAGIAYSRKQLESDIQFKSYPEAHLLPNYVDTGKIAADSADLLGAELLGVFGPFSLQSEYIQANVNADEDLSFPGVYVLASYFITGEHKNYKLGSGTLGMQKVASPYIGADGPGAWEVTGRYSWLDLSDGSVAGGELTDMTAGVNWYLNSNARIMLNYVYSDLNDVGKSHILENRLQIAF